MRLAAVALAVLLGTWWRLAPVGSALLFGDEFHSLRDLSHGWKFVFTHFSDTGSGMALPILVRGLGELFGYDHWTIRFPAWGAGVALLVCTYPVSRRWIGGTGAAVATWLVATSPLLIFYSHFGRAYALVTLLCVLLLALLQRIVDGAPARAGVGVGAAVLVALLPYVQPISVGFVVPVYAAVLCSLWRDARRRDALVVAASGLAGVVLTLAAHAPARASIEAYLRFQESSAYYAGFGWLDIAALLVGNRAAALAVLPLLAVAAGDALARRRWRSLPLLAGVLGPVAALAWADPFGGPYAFARYLIPAIPFASVLLGDLAVHASERVGEPAALALGVVAAVALFAAGPYGLRHTPDGQYANTYITMYPLPAFDVPWDGMPAFYRRLAQEPDARIIEVPALVTRSRHLYRNYQLQHGAQTLLGIAFPWEVPDPPDGPYVDFGDPDWRERADADYLILHRRVENELKRYWQFVYYDQRELAEEPSVAAYMERQRRYGGYRGRQGRIPAALRQRLERELGAPDYTDADIDVWRLR